MAMAFALYIETLLATGTSFAAARMPIIRDRHIKLGAGFKTRIKSIVIQLLKEASWGTNG